MIERATVGVIEIAEEERHFPALEAYPSQRFQRSFLHCANGRERQKCVEGTFQPRMPRLSSHTCAYAYVQPPASLFEAPLATAVCHTKMG